MGVNQKHLNEQAARFLEYNKRDQGVADEFRSAGGYCYGYSTLYAYSRWVSSRHRRHNITTTKSVDDYAWFKSMTKLLDEWAPDKYSVTQEKEIDRFIGLLRFHQKSFEFIGETAGGQRDLDRYLERISTQQLTTNDKSQQSVPLSKEFVITGNYTPAMLARTLQLVAKPNKMITLHAQGHATSIFCENQKLYFYDSNGKEGEVSADSLIDLANLIHKGHTFEEAEKTRAIPISIKTYDIPNPDLPTYYPNQRVLLDILDKVNTRLGIPSKDAGRMAFQSDDVHSFSFYLEKGLDINEQTEDRNETFLMQAIVRDYDVIFDVLLMSDPKPDLELKNNLGVTALFYSVIFQRPRMLEKLLTLGADVSCRDEKERTVLHYAAIRGDIKSVDTLLDFGSDLDCQDTKGRTALMYAAANGDQQMAVKLLTRGANPNLKNARGQTALMLAIKQKNTTMVKLLVDNGARVDVRDEAGFTARMLATFSRASDLLPVIKEAGARHSKLDVIQLMVITALENKDTQKLQERVKPLFDKQASFDLDNPQHLFLLASFFAHDQEKMGRTLMEKTKEKLSPQQIDSMVEMGKVYFKPAQVEKLQASLYKLQSGGARPNWTQANKTFPKSYTSLWRKQIDPIQATIKLMEDYHDPIKSVVHRGRKYQQQTKTIVNFCKTQPPPTPEQLREKLVKMDAEHVQARESEHSDGQENRGAYRRRLNYCINKIDDYVKTQEVSSGSSKKASINSPRGLSN